MVACDGLRPEPFTQLIRNAFRHFPRIDKNQRRAVLQDQLNEAVVHLLPDFHRHDGAERRARHFHRQVPPSRMPGIDNGAIVATIADAGQKQRHFVDRFLRRRQTDPYERTAGDPLETLQ